MEQVSPQFVIEGLMRRGYPAHVAQGFVMNMMDESGLRPGINEAAPIVPGSRGGFGLYQLTGPRRTAYEQFAAQRGVNPADANAQLDFLDYEMKGPESRAAKSILSTSNPQEAAVAIARDFLRPASEHLQNRVARYSGADVAADTMAALGKGGGAVTPDQIAQSAQAQSTGMQEEQQPRGLLGGLFGNPDLMANLAIAFNSMRLNPDPNLPQVLSAQMKQRRDERKSKQELNKTVAMLESIGADPRLIELAKAGYAKEAIAQAYKAPKDAQVVEVDGRLIRYDPKTGAATQIYGPQAGADTLSKDQMATLNSLRDDLRTELKPFEIVKQGYNNITTFYNNPSATSDYALAVAFAKVLDPGSVAREGEVAAVQNAGARIPALGQALKNAITGEGQLTQEVRQQIAELATAIYQERAQEAGSIISGYSELARRGNVPADLLYSGNIPEARKVIPAIVPPAAQRQGVTQEMWSKATPEEKQAWMD